MSETEKKQFVISKIKQIVKDESFKIDAFYFCGFPGGTPNEKLKNVCEKYLKAVENDNVDAEIKQNLIVELENAIGKLEKEKAGMVVNNMQDVKDVLDNKEYL